jgi:hypothetical protein
LPARTGSASAETHNIKKLMRDTAPFAFEKCFSERSVFTWSDNVQQDILYAARHMVELTALKLKVGAMPTSPFSFGGLLVGA